MMLRRVRFLITAASYQRGRSAGRRHRGGDPRAVRNPVEEGGIGSSGQDAQLGRRDQAQGYRLARQGAAVAEPTAAAIGPMQPHRSQVIRHLVDGEYTSGPDAVLLEEGKQAGVLLRLLGDAQDGHLAARARRREANASWTVGRAAIARDGVAVGAGRRA